MTEKRAWTVAVLGPGGVGGLVGALLARAGHRVIFLGGPETVGALRDHGIQVRSGQFGDFTVKVEADTELREAVDVCLVSVKQTSLAGALARVSPEAVGDGLIVPLLNGIEHPALLRARYRPELVAPGIIRVESTRVAPGEIVQGSPFVDIELASATAPPERLDALAEILNAAGIRTQAKEDEAAALWAKLLFIAPVALMTTRYRSPVGVIRTEHRGEFIALLDEVAELSRVAGLPGDVDAVLRFCDTFPPETKSSMLRDAEAGRPLEVDALGGALLRTALRHGVAMPLTERLVDEVVRPATSP
ncbi:ketopantoate reductase family protein [Nocardia sp. NPDC127526]|uniref:ketopantoate reductase family protein n=1 Tax=Nocardia sp. NPDC127526 TaxID=3345393 RepID=UPI0036434F55